MKLTDREIIGALIAGKKIRLPWWAKGYYLQAFDDLTWELEIYDADGKVINEVGLTIVDIEADVWEVIE